MKEVIIYSTPTCPYCVMAKKYMEEKGVKHKVIDVSQNPSEAEKMQEKSGQLGVPVVIVTNDEGKENVIVGFDKPKIDELLGLK